MIPVPGHPFASYAITPAGSGCVLIVAACSHCGAQWQRRCHRPELANGYVLRFATIHAHGLRPRIAGP